MCPFQDSVYITSKDIKTLKLPRRDGKRPNVVEDEARKYRELRKCYQEKYFGLDKGEEDKRFKNWQRWMEERKKVHLRLGKRTERYPASLVMNSTEGRRLEEEMKSLMHYAQTIVKPDPLRGGPEFWKGPLMMPPPCCCMPPIEVQRPPEEVGKIPVMEHVGIPVAIREEKGLYGFSEVRDVRKRWMRSDYLEHRASALRHKVLYLADHFPDTSMIVEGHALGKDSESLDETRRSSLVYQHDLEAAWAARMAAKQAAQSFVCPVDSAMMHWHDVTVQPDASAQTLQKLAEEQWAQVAKMAENLGSVVIGDSFTKPTLVQRKRSSVGPPPPMLVVTPAPGLVDRFPHTNRRKTGSMALAEGPETEIEPQLLVRIVIGSVVLWREPPHPPPVAVMDKVQTLGEVESEERPLSYGSLKAKSKSNTQSTSQTKSPSRTTILKDSRHRYGDEDEDEGPEYHSNIDPSWDLMFESPVGHRSTSILTIENTGCMTLDVRWVQEQGPGAKLGGGLHPQAFFLHRPSTVCPPGQRRDLEVSFYAKHEGLYRETWLLKTDPKLAPPCMRLPLRLWGMTTELHDDGTDDRAQIVTPFSEVSASNPDATSALCSSYVANGSTSKTCSQQECPGRLARQVAHEEETKALQAAEEQMEKDLTAKVAAEQKARREKYDKPWTGITCMRADCRARVALRKIQEPPWPLGSMTQRDVNEYLDACIMRAELVTMEMKKRRFGLTSTPPPYRSLYVDEEVFEHVNPGYCYRVEPVKRLREIWTQATGRKPETWDMSLHTLRQALLRPPAAVCATMTTPEQQQLLEEMNEAVKELQKPVPSAASHRSSRAAADACIAARTCEGVRTCAEAVVGDPMGLRRWGPGMSRGRRAAYAAAYGALCCFANSMEAEANAIRTKLGLSKASPGTRGKRGTSRVPASSTVKGKKNRNVGRTGSSMSGMSLTQSTTGVNGPSVSSVGGGRTRSQSRNRKNRGTQSSTAHGGPRDARVSKSTVGSGVSDASSFRGTAAEGFSEGDIAASTPTTANGAASAKDSPQRLHAHYLDSLYVKTYHLLTRAVEQVVAAAESADLLDF